MSNYAETNLTNNEKIILKAKKSFIAIFPHFIRFLTTELALTNKKVIGKVGLIRTHSVASALNKNSKHIDFKRFVRQDIQLRNYKNRNRRCRTRIFLRHQKA